MSVNEVKDSDRRRGKYCAFPLRDINSSDLFDGGGMSGNSLTTSCAFLLKSKRIVKDTTLLFNGEKGKEKILLLYRSERKRESSEGD